MMMSGAIVFFSFNTAFSMAQSASGRAANMAAAKDVSDTSCLDGKFELIFPCKSSIAVSAKEGSKPA